MPSAIDEIVVEGFRGPRFRNPPQPTGIAPSLPGTGPAGGIGGPGGPLEPIDPEVLPRPPVPVPDAGFVPPVLPPQLVPEIVVTGSPAVRPAFGIGTAPAVNLGFLFGVVGGNLVAAILDDLGQSRLDAAMRELMVPETPPPDTPVITMQPEVLPEIVVTASPMQRFRALLPQVIPQPFRFLTPDIDPFRMVPIEPRFVPQPSAVPPVSIPQPTLPQTIPTPVTIPLPLPSVRPSIRPSIRPSVRPGTRPDIRPAIDPSTLPGTDVQPGVSPQPGVATNPLTGIRSSAVPSTSTRAATDRRADLRTQISEAQSQCPPPPQCKKDEELEKPRDRCFKQLVKQGLFPSMDQTFDWVELDCLTGREL